MKFEPVRRHSKLYQEVAEQIRTRIMDGQLGPGDQLPGERELAEQFAVSRVTIRQALVALETMGFIEIRVGSGTYMIDETSAITVARFASALSFHEGMVSQPMEARRLVEPALAALAAERAGPQDIAALQQSLDRQVRLVAQGEPFSDEDSSFHLSIAKAAGNDIMLHVVGILHNVVWTSRARSHRLTPKVLSDSLEHHERILAAIESRSSESAYAAMMFHLTEIEGALSEAR